MIFRLAGTYVSEVILGMEEFSGFDLEVNVLAAATDAGDVLGLYLQTSYDKGVTWTDLMRFFDILGNDVVPEKYQRGGSLAGDGDVALFASFDVFDTVNYNFDLMHGDRLRLKAVITDANANSSWTLTGSVWARV